LEEAFVEGMTSLVELHPKTGVGEAGVYLGPDDDKQVGLGILGLANFLAQEGVTYAELAAVSRAWSHGEEVPDSSSKAKAITRGLMKAIDRATDIAKAAGLKRAFAIAPTASCSYRSVDLRGYACTPELAPPISRSIDRDSGTFGVQTYEYPPNVEIAAEVGWQDYSDVADLIVTLFSRSYGLFHGYSFNSWSDQVSYDRSFLIDWLYGPQTSLYYALQVAPDTQAKDDALGALNEDHLWPEFAFEHGLCSLTDRECQSCAE
jgi:hypothetical protein